MKHFLRLSVSSIILAATGAQAQWAGPGTNNAVCTATDIQDVPVVVSTDSGGVIVAWEDNRSGNYNIYAQRIDSSGSARWTSNGVAICNASGNQRNPQAVSDGSGGAIIVWEDSRGTSSDIYAQRINKNGDTLWTSNGVVICGASALQDRPRITSDGSGGAVICWQDQRTNATTAQDIYAQRINSSGSVVWTANGVVICNASEAQLEPVLANDDSTGAIIVWDDRRDTDDGIYAQRVDSTGAVKWTSNGITIAAYVFFQVKDLPALIRDGSGGAIVAWQDGRGGGYDIYAQRVNSAGSVQWTANGVAICTSGGDQSQINLLSDGSSGAIITWQDQRGSDFDVYAQRVNSSGTVQWTSNGEVISDTTGNQQLPVIASDGGTGAIITWQGYQTGNSNVYAQRINSSGAVQWASNGVALTTVSDDQTIPAIASDALGNAIIVWKDLRNSGTTGADIYAEKVESGGNVLPVELVSFTAYMSKRGVELQWVTATEVNNYGFEIERRAIVKTVSAGSSSPLRKPEWIKIGFVAGNGTSNVQRSYSFLDPEASFGRYDYRLKQIDHDGMFEYSQVVTVAVGPVDDKVVLAQNYPNPFNPATTIQFSIPVPGATTLKIYNVLGEEISILMSDDLTAGVYNVEWNASGVPTGLYFYRLESTGRVEIKKLLLLK